jgi:type IV secretory pathway VirJ component
MPRLVMLVALLAVSQPPVAQERLSHGRFRDVTVYRPQGQVKHVVLFLSGDNGWSEPVVGMARKLVDRGAMVAGIDTRQLVTALEADSASCVYPDGDLENLSHYLQGYARLPSYHTPLLVGYSSGATLAYAMIAQAPEGTFAGALSLGFCIQLDVAKPMCRGDGLRFTRRPDGRGAVDLLPSKELAVDWVVLQGARDRVCATAPARNFAAQVQRARFIELPSVTHSYSTAADWAPQFLEAYTRLSAKVDAAQALPPATLADLPLVEIRAAKAGPTFAVMLSGDGGWAGLDKDVAVALANKGIDVVGLDSLRYFWSARSPQSLAVDLDRLVRHYAAQWRKTSVVLIGYSQGADVLPFAINRLPPASRQLVTYTVMMGLGTNASFEFHVGNWLGGEGGAIPIQPEATKLQPNKTLCIYGAEEKDSLCPRLAPGSVEAHMMPGGHHFDGAFDELASVILERVAR